MIGDFEHVFIDGTVRLHALVKGEGPLVLMCHGFPGLSYSFRHQLRALRLRPGAGASCPSNAGAAAWSC